MQKDFLTLAQTAKLPQIPYSFYRLQIMAKKHQIPGLFSGNRFYVNIPLFIKQIEASCKPSIGEEKDA